MTTQEYYRKAVYKEKYSSKKKEKMKGTLSKKSQLEKNISVEPAFLSQQYSIDSPA